MSLPALIAVIVGSGIVWCAVSTTAAVVIGRVIHRRDQQRPEPTPARELAGYELDARYYAVVAESWQ